MKQVDLRARLTAYEILFACVMGEFYKYYEQLEQDIKTETNESIKKLLIERKAQLEKSMSVLDL